MPTESQNPVQIAAFYHFAPVEAAQVEALAARLEALGETSGLRGLIIFAAEGINGTISGRTQEAVVQYLSETSDILGFPKFQPKWSQAPEWPFRKFKVRVREEIVTLGKPEVQPLAPQSPTHLSPEAWDKALQEEDVVVLDTRNWYETRIGKFKNAIDPKIEEFQDFSNYLDESGIKKDQKVLIYCTGGIRCEKAIVEMKSKGFEKVFQLDGGILNYLAQKPNAAFEGECFVFDSRVAVDQKLEPTKLYKMCPHCGQPADQVVQCLRCDSESILCTECSGGTDQALKTCSKNCANHYRLAPGKKGRSQNQGYRYEAAQRLRPVAKPTKVRTSRSTPQRGN